MHGPRYKVAFRRRREGVTDYAHRLKLIRSERPRAVVRKSNRYYTVQFVAFRPGGDAVLASASSIELRKFGWSGSASNVAAAYLTGYLAGVRARKKGIESTVLDGGLTRPRKNSGIFAAMTGIAESGVEIAHGEGTEVQAKRIEEVASRHGTVADIRSKIGGV